MTILTILVPAVVGIASALLTIIFTPTLQHYFWRRQRHAEQQFAVIEELNTLAAEMHTFLLTSEDLDGDRQEQLYLTLVRARHNATALFSYHARQQYLGLDNAILEALFLPEPSASEQRKQVNKQLFHAHQAALTALYRDMGIPPPPPRQWMREHAWQPLQTQVWDRPQQYWCATCWPTFRRWGGQAWTRMRRSCPPRLKGQR
jgi:hypothetical protein